ATTGRWEQSASELLSSDTGTRALAVDVKAARLLVMVTGSEEVAREISSAGRTRDIKRPSLSMPQSVASLDVSRSAPALLFRVQHSIVRTVSPTSERL